MKELDKKLLKDIDNQLDKILYKIDIILKILDKE